MGRPVVRHYVLIVGGKTETTWKLGDLIKFIYVSDTVFEFT